MKTPTSSNRIACATGLAMFLAFSLQAGAAVLYEQSFDTDDTANWTVNNGLGTNTSNFYYDYSPLGIPSAPNSSGGSTRGLRLQANLGPSTAANTIPGLSVSPNGQSFTGDYRVTFDLWLNFNGAAGISGSGNGTTQAAGAGILTNGTSAQTAGTASSVYFATTLDGGSTADYRLYTSAATASYADNHGVYSPATTRNSSNSYYSTAFPGGALAPSQQTSLYSPASSTAAPVGTIAFGWHQVTIDYIGGWATFSIDSTQIATVNTSGLTTGGNNILLTYFDTNNTASTDPLAATLLFALYDNIRVEQIPEPSALAFVGMATLGLLRRRRF